MRIQKFLIAPIVAYQKFISPLFPARCKYYPSCSQYAVDAFTHLNPATAFAKSLWRLVRCNPWSHGGVDYAFTPHKTLTGVN